LDGREREVRPTAPPDLRVLGDRVGLVEEPDVRLPLLPVGERVGDTAAREHAREDLRPSRVEVREGAFHKRRARRERKQLRQVVPEGRTDANRAVGAVDADVYVDAERVVAPDDVAEDLVVAAVVRRVDDSLLLPRAPGMRAGCGEGDPARVREPAKLPATLADEGRSLGERV